ncbi:LAME_0G17788g1_1 [Lachancea meyersii CBS 8951]|uniref:LAME_0G17788g1_1 n=1 Tax=Lachancea meyersii CBS 8951 TaxID=1266667 RepID=A0A1G4KBN9_9SACH|nr:LAME_0G17788g1_1 [Lachancea meyersii CBS 8951]
MSTGSSSNKKLSIEERLSLAARAKTRRKGKRLDSPSPVPTPQEADLGAVSTDANAVKLDTSSPPETPTDSGGNDRAQLGSDDLNEISVMLPSDYQEMTKEALLIALKPYLVGSLTSAPIPEQSGKELESREPKDNSLVKLIKEKDSIIEDLRKEGESLSKLELRHSNIIKGLRDKLKASDYELERLKKDTERKANEHTSLSRDFAQLEKKYHETNKQLSKVLEEREEVRARNEALEKGQLLELQDQVSSDQKTIKALQSHLQMSRDKLETASMKAEMKYQSLEATSKEEIARLETSLEETRISSRHFSTISEPQRNQVELAEKLQRFEKELETGRQSWSRLESALRQELYEAECKLTECSKERSIASDSLVSARDENASLNSQIHTLKLSQQNLKNEVKELESMIEKLDHSLSNAKDETKLWQEKYMVRKSELDSLLNDPRARDEMKSQFEPHIQDKEETPTDLEGLDKISNWEFKNLQTLDTDCNNNQDSVSIRSQYDLDELLPREDIELSSNLRKSSITSLDYTSSRQQNKTINTQQNTQMNAQMISRLASQVRRLETELASLQGSHGKLLKEKQAVNDTIFKLMEENEQVTEVKNQLKISCEHEKRLEQELSKTAELLSERTERVEELENDVDDLKELMQMQVQQLVELQEQVR